MSNTPTASTHRSSSRFRVKLSNRDGYTTIKSARKLVKRGQARWAGALILHIIDDGEEPNHCRPVSSSVPTQRAALDVRPLLPWMDCYRTTESITMPVEPTWLKRMGYRLKFGMGAK